VSLDASRWAWEQQCPDATAKLVLLALANRCAKERGGVCECFPSLNRIARDTQLSRGAVVKAAKRLDAAGLVRRDPGGPGRATTYRLPVGTRATGDSAPRAPSGAQGSARDARHGARREPDSAPDAPALVHHVHPNQSVEPVMNQSENRREIAEKGIAAARDALRGKPPPPWMDPTTTDPDEPLAQGAKSA